MGIVGGGEASAASQPATVGRSTRHDRHWFGRLEQEDQRLKKHYGRWMDIVWSMELESCILTKLTKPSIPDNLVGRQVNLPLYWVLARKWNVLLKNYKWVVVNSIRNQKWVVHSYKSQMGYMFSATHLWAF